MDIRKILNIITEAEKPLASGMKVMSPAEFLQSQGIEPKSSEEDVSEDNDTIYKNWRKDVGTDYDTTLKLVDKDYNPKAPRNVADELAKMNKKLKGVAEGSGKNVVKSVKVGNFRHDLVDTGMGWQVRIYNGDELYDTGMSKNSEQKGLAALEDAVAYTEKQTRTKRQDVGEGSDIAYVVSYFEKITGDKGETTVSAISPDKAAEKVAKDMGKHGYPLVVYHVRRAESVAEGAPKLLKQEMPLVRHIEKELEQYGYMKGTAEYDEKFKHAIAFYRKFGNIDAIKQGVAEDLDEAKLDVSARPFPKDELIKYLDRVVGEPVLDKEGKPKLDKKGNPQFKSLKTKTDKYKFPYIHRSNVPIVNQNGQKYDLDKLASLFTERPSKILKQNEKMQHSDGTASQFYNVGLPALIGLAVDEDSNEFVVINTCPGAGNCKLVCYAMKGGYIQYPASNLSQTRLLNFLYNDPDGFMGMLENEIAGFEAKNSKKNIKTIIRWHDAGDFFSPEYLDKAYNLAKKFPDVDFYAYTKLASVAQGDKPDNFKINFSMGAQPSQEKKIDFAKTKNSRIVPEVIFADLLEKDKAGKWQYKNPQAEQAVKDRIAAKYSLDPKSIITYDEMMKIPVGKEKGKWNVIVKPGDGDDAANRNDVLSSLLLIH